VDSPGARRSISFFTVLRPPLPAEGRPGAHGAQGTAGAGSGGPAAEKEGARPEERSNAFHGRAGPPRFQHSKLDRIPETVARRGRGADRPSS